MCSVLVCSNVTCFLLVRFDSWLCRLEYWVTTCLEMSGNLTAVREMSGILLKVREVSFREMSGKKFCQGKVA